MYPLSLEMHNIAFVKVLSFVKDESLCKSSLNLIPSHCCISVVVTRANIKAQYTDAIQMHVFG